METQLQLEQHLKRLRMPGMLSTLELRLAEAQQNQLGYAEFLSLLAQDEVISRENNNLQKRIMAAGFGSEKTFSGFDYRFNDHVMPKAMVRDLASCHFFEQKQCLVLAGPPGIGKTHIAKAIGHEVCRRGCEVLFRKTARLLEELSDRSSPRRAERLMKRCLSVDLLILDDFALRKYDQKESELLYALVDERLGRTSTVLTSNRPPDDWFGAFPDPVIGGAILDRLVSGAVQVIVTKGRSYRREGVKCAPADQVDSVSKSE
jgi:DNA replication protein DnaC